MTTPHRLPADALAPPPGCPAHGQAPSGLQRLTDTADPARLYEELRERYGAVAPVLLYGDLPAWIVLGYRECLDVLHTPSKFSRDSRLWTEFRENRVPMDSPLMPMIGWQPLCVFADGPEHARLRSAVVDGLNQFSRRGMRHYVAAYTREIVQGFARTGRADLVRDFAEPLPMLVISRALGIAPDAGPALVEPTLDLMRGSETAAASNALVTEVLRDLVTRKRAEPGDNDLASRLILHEAQLSDTEVVEHLRLVLVAAHQGTVNLIAHTLRMVLTDARFRGSLSGGRMTLPDALDQVMWDNPSISVIPGRWATGDTTLGNQQIKKGDFLLIGLAAANVDPEQRPDLTVPMHGNRSHLALSAGPHECPGGHIGRSIAETGIDELLALLPDLQLSIGADEVGIAADWLTRRPASLPVHFTPPRPRGASMPSAAPPPAAQPLPAAAAQPPPAELPRSARPSWFRSLIGR